MAEHIVTQDSSSGMGFFLGVLALIIFFIFLMYYGLPILRGATSTPQINVPKDVNVNVQQKK